MPKEEGLKVTEDAKTVARDISVRGCHWSDGYDESFAEYVDRLSHFVDLRGRYLSGAKNLRDVCDKANDRDPLWEQLDLDPANKKNVKYCCDKIIELMH